MISSPRQSQVMPPFLEIEFIEVIVEYEFAGAVVQHQETYQCSYHILVYFIQQSIKLIQTNICTNIKWLSQSPSQIHQFHNSSAIPRISSLVSSFPSPAAARQRTAQTNLLCFQRQNLSSLISTAKISRAVSILCSALTFWQPSLTALISPLLIFFQLTWEYNIRYFYSSCFLEQILQHAVEQHSGAIIIASHNLEAISSEVHPSSCRFEGDSSFFQRYWSKIKTAVMKVEGWNLKVVRASFWSQVRSLVLILGVTAFSLDYLRQESLLINAQKSSTRISVSICAKILERCASSGSSQLSEWQSVTSVIANKLIMAQYIKPLLLSHSKLHHKYHIFAQQYATNYYPFPSHLHHQHPKNQILHSQPRLALQKPIFLIFFLDSVQKFAFEMIRIHGESLRERDNKVKKRWSWANEVEQAEQSILKQFYIFIDNNSLNQLLIKQATTHYFSICHC